MPTDQQILNLCQTLGKQLCITGERLVTAESCTGGWITKAITDVPGSSAWFECGIVTYSYEAKQALLGVRPVTLEIHGAVSRETVIEMASGALAHSCASIAMAVTGIAGPDGGSTNKPIGNVWINWKRRDGYANPQFFRFN
ncbi:MAG TPA: CinA family protein, partial [Xylella sp.]